MNKKLAIMIILPYCVVFLSFLIIREIEFNAGLTPEEMKVLDYSSDVPEIKEKTSEIIDSSLKNPFGSSVMIEPKDFPVLQLSVNAPGIISTEKIDFSSYYVSLIVISKGEKLAIIKDKVVKEGERIDGIRVSKIEDKRVLLSKNHLSKWLRLEKGK